MGLGLISRSGLGAGALDDGDLVRLRSQHAIQVGRPKVGVEELVGWRRWRHEVSLGPTQQRWQLNGHAAAAARTTVVPHVRTHVHLEVAFGGESAAAHGALKGPVTSVCAHVDLERTRAREGLVAHVAHVPWQARRSPGRRRPTRRRSHRFHPLGPILVGAGAGSLIGRARGAPGTGYRTRRARTRGRGGCEQGGRQISDLVCQHVLLEVSLGGEAPLADAAFERSLFGVAPIVDLESTVAGKRLEAYLACCIRAAGRGSRKRQSSQRRSGKKTTRKVVRWPT